MVRRVSLFVLCLKLAQVLQYTLMFSNIINVFDMKFSKIYPLLVAKAEKKGRTKEEVDELAKGKPMEKILR